MSQHEQRDRVPGGKAPANLVDTRRRAVARAGTLPELVAAHGSVGSFLQTPYAEALASHRQDVLGWSSEDAEGELRNLRP